MAKAKRKLDTFRPCATVSTAIIANEYGAKMPKAKIDVESDSAGKKQSSVESKASKTENGQNLLQESPEANFGKKEGKGKPMPGMVTPPVDATRISIKFTDGKIDTDALRDDNAKAVKGYLKASMADAKIRQWAGIGGTAESDGLAVKIPPPVAGAMLDIIPFAAGMALAKNTGLEMRQVYPLVRWTDADHGALDAQTALLMEKYMPESWKQYSDVGIFCMTLITLFKMKTVAVAELAKKELEKIGNAPEPKFISQPTQAPITATPPAKPMLVPEKPLPPPAATGNDPANRSLE